MNPDQSFGGKIVHKASDDEGIIKFRAHNATCYAYFLVYNVYITQSVQAKNWADIGLKKGANFQIAFCVSSSLHIAGLVWLQRKPLNCPVIQFNQNRAILVLSSYFSSIQITIPTPPVSSTNKAQKNASQNKSQTVRVTPADALSGFTARIWKVINDDEGLLYLMHKSYRTIIWFNKSNLQRIQKKFVSIRELLDLVFHVDAKLIYSPKNPGQNDYVWYHALAFWDEKTSRPETFGHVIGDNLDSYEPTSLYSAKLKQAFEFKQNGINSAVVEKLFKELSIFDFNVINSSVPKVPDVNREGVKNDNQILLPNVDDKVGFVAARGNDMGGLHPFQWTALNSWKVGAVDANVSGSSSVQSPSTGSVSLQKPKDVEDPYMLLFHAKRPVVTDLEEKFNKVTLKPSEENIQHDNKFNLKQCLRECIKNDVKEPELNRIVDSFHNQVLKHKPKEVIEYVTNMFAEKGITVNESYPLGYDKQVQTMSTGNVIYLNIFPDSI